MAKNAFRSIAQKSFTQTYARTFIPAIAGATLFFFFSAEQVSQADSRSFTQQNLEQHYDSLEKALLDEESEVLKRLGMKTHDSRENKAAASAVKGGNTSAGGGPDIVANVLGKTVVNPVVPVIPERMVVAQETTPNTPEGIADSLKAQQAEIEQLANQFQLLDEKSSSLEKNLYTVQEDLIDVRTDKLLASLKARDLAELTNDMIELEADASQEKEGQELIEWGSQNGEAMEEIPNEDTQPVAAPSRKTVEIASNDSELYLGQGVSLPKRPVRKVENAALYFGDKTISDEMPIAELVAVAVPFKTGPANSFPTLFRGVQGDVVAIEKRYDNWFRVVHQSGMRGWINESDFLFGENSRALPGRRIVRVRPYNAESDRTDFEDAG